MATATLTPREQLEKLIPEMQTFADECDRKDGGATAEDRAQLEAMGKDVTDAIANVKAAATAGGTINLASQFLGELSSKGASASPAMPGPGEIDSKTGIINPNGMTLGEAFAKSPGYQELLRTSKSSDGAISKGYINRGATFEAPDLYAPQGKALITGLSDTSAGAFVVTERLPITSDLIGERRLYVRDLCTNITINSDTFDYVTVTGKTNAAAPVLEATTSATPGLNNVAVGVYTAAHGVKPESTLTFAVVSSIVETIAHIIPMTRRAAADGGQVRQMVDAFLLYGLREEEEDQILNGNGTTPNLRGIVPVVGNTVGSAGTDIDAVVDAIAAIRDDFREPTGLVIHPGDWFSTGFLLAKDTAGNYIIGDPRASLDQLNTLWGLKVVVTPAMTQNTALVGDFRQAVVADRQQSTIYVTDSHNDWFARNLLAILAEERLGFGILDVDAFCTITAV